MENLSLEGEQIIKDIRNLFRQEKETKAINDRILRDIKDHLEYEEEKQNYYKQERVRNFWRNGDRNKTLSIKECLSKFRPYLKGNINNPKKM